MRDDSRWDDRVKELWSRKEIYEAALRYCRGCDRCDKELIRSAFHEDGFDDHGQFKGSPTEFADWADNLHRNLCTNTAHCVLNHLVEFEPNDPNIAYAETYVIACLRTHKTDIVAMGRYMDRFECRNGCWRIAHRTTLLDWQRVDPIGSSPTMTMDIVAGLRSRADLTYSLFPSTRSSETPPNVYDSVTGQGD